MSHSEQIGEHTTNAVRADEEEIGRNERLMGIGIFLAVAILTLSDLVEDRAEGAEWTHLLVESTIMFVCIFGAIHLWYKSKRLLVQTSHKLTSEIVAARADAAKWRRESSAFLDGLGKSIDQQFTKWALTEAEKEVGLLLLKGLSHKEVAEVRNSSERTVRQQAAAVYRKGNLDGRAQLSAFFLEDLLLPSRAKE